MRVNEKCQEIHISVKELIQTSKNKIFKMDSIPYRIRMSQGTELHQHYQENQSKIQINFQKEAPIKIVEKVGEWKFIISGRADCVFEMDKWFIIEEIKTISDISTFNIKSKTGHDYIHQLMIYSYYFINQKLKKKIKSNLILIEVHSGIQKKIEIEYQNQSDFIQNQCKIIIRNWSTEKERKKMLQSRFKSINFPYKSLRPYQKEIIDGSREIIKNKGRLMISAPSGLGKTIGSLYPALYETIKNNLRLFIVTSKTTQHKIYLDTLKSFEKKGAKFQSIILTAKEKMCTNDVYICDKAICPYIENYEKADIDSIRNELLKKQILTGQYIKKKAKELQLCPFEVALDCSLNCDVIVGDYNYVFHPAIRLKRFFDQSYSDMLLIVDEAHNLPFRALSYYSPEISLRELHLILDDLHNTKINNAIIEIGDKILNKIVNYINETIEEHQYSDKIKTKIIKINNRLFKNILSEFDKFIVKYVYAYTKQHGYHPKKKDRIIEFSSFLHLFYSILNESEIPEFSHLCNLKEKSIKIFCKSAAFKLEKQMKGFHSIICQSATLFPSQYYRKILGFPSSFKNLIFKSPYSNNNRLYLGYSNVSTKYEYRDQSYSEIAQLISKVTGYKKGNYLAFFPSFKYLDSVHSKLEMQNLNVELLIQKKKMTEKARREYIKKLKVDDKKYILLAVQGGIFSEGVDFPGDMAIGAFIIGPGLPAYTFEQELMKNYYDYRWKKGFEYAYRNIGMTKVIQAAGRIFRSNEDRGIICLIGSRFNTSYYKDALPEEWNLYNSRNPLPYIEKFWNSFQQEKQYHQNLLDIKKKKVD